MAAAGEDAAAVVDALGMMLAGHMLEMIIATAVDRTVAGLLEGKFIINFY